MHTAARVRFLHRELERHVEEYWSRVYAWQEEQRMIEEQQYIQEHYDFERGDWKY